MKVFKNEIVQQKKDSAMKQTITDIICGLLILLFVYAAMNKLFAYEEFRMQLSRSPWLTPYAVVIAWLVPAVELIISGLLTVSALRVYGLYASWMLLLFFTLYIAGMLWTQAHLPCSCGGVISRLSWPQHLVFNLFFMALCSWGILLESRHTRMQFGRKPPAEAMNIE